MLFLGQASLRGDIKRYAQDFDLLELLAEPGRLPKTKKLAQWRADVGSEFVFSVRVSQRLWHSEGAAEAEMIRYAGAAAAALQAQFVLLQTPYQATPTARNKERMKRLFAGLRTSGARQAWEPHGVWESSQLGEWASDLEALLVRDLSQEDSASGPVVYTRLLALGQARQVRSSAVFRVLEQVEDCEQAYVVMEGTGARGAAKLFRGELEQ